MEHNPDVVIWYRDKFFVTFKTDMWGRGRPVWGSLQQAERFPNRAAAEARIGRSHSWFPKGEGKVLIKAFDGHYIPGSNPDLEYEYRTGEPPPYKPSWAVQLVTIGIFVIFVGAIIALGWWAILWLWPGK